MAACNLARYLAVRWPALAIAAGVAVRFSVAGALQWHNSMEAEAPLVAAVRDFLLRDRGHPASRSAARSRPTVSVRRITAHLSGLARRRLQEGAAGFASRCIGTWILASGCGGVSGGGRAGTEGGAARGGGSVGTGASPGWNLMHQEKLCEETAAAFGEEPVGADSSTAAVGAWSGDMGSDRPVTPGLRPDAVALWLSSATDLFVVIYPIPGHGAAAGGSAAGLPASGRPGPQWPKWPKWKRAGSSSAMGTAMLAQGGFVVRPSRRLWRRPNLRTKKCFFRYVEPRETPTPALQDSESAGAEAETGTTSRGKQATWLDVLPATLRPVCDHGPSCKFAHWHGELLPRYSAASPTAIEGGTGGGGSKPRDTKGALTWPVDDGLVPGAWHKACQAFQSVVAAAMLEGSGAAGGMSARTSSHPKVSSVAEARLVAASLGYYHAAIGRLGEVDESAWMRQHPGGPETQSATAPSKPLGRTWCLPRDGRHRAVRVLMGSIPADLLAYRKVKGAEAPESGQTLPCPEMSPAEVLSSILQANLAGSKHPVVIASDALLRGIQAADWPAGSFADGSLDTVGLEASRVLAEAVWLGREGAAVMPSEAHAASAVEVPQSPRGLARHAAVLSAEIARATAVLVERLDWRLSCGLALQPREIAPGRSPMPGPRPGLALVRRCADFLCQPGALSTLDKHAAAAAESALGWGRYAAKAWACAGRQAATETVEMVLAYARHLSVAGSDSLPSSADEGSRRQSTRGSEKDPSGSDDAGSGASPMAAQPRPGPAASSLAGSEAGRSSDSRRRKRGRRRRKARSDGLSEASAASAATPGLLGRGKSFRAVSALATGSAAAVLSPVSADAVRSQGEQHFGIERVPATSLPLLLRPKPLRSAMHAESIAPPSVGRVYETAGDGSEPPGDWSRVAARLHALPWSSALALSPLFRRSQPPAMRSLRLWPRRLVDVLSELDVLQLRSTNPMEGDDEAGIELEHRLAFAAAAFILASAVEAEGAILQFSEEATTDVSATASTTGPADASSKGVKTAEQAKGERAKSPKSRAAASDPHPEDAAHFDDPSILRYGSQSISPQDGRLVALAEGLKAPDGSLVPVLNNSYVLDSSVPYPEDDGHEFKGGLHGGPSRAITRVAVRYLVGFLNSRGGVLYFGISNGGKVRGVYLTQEAEDELRLSLDKVKHNCIGPDGSWVFVRSPELVPVVVPVAESARSGEGKGQQLYRQLPRVFVVELLVYPSHSPSNLHYQIAVRSAGSQRGRAGAASGAGEDWSTRSRSGQAGQVSERIYWIRSGASTRRMTSPQEMVEWGFDRGRAFAAAQIVGRAAAEGQSNVVDLVQRMQLAREAGGRTGGAVALEVRSRETDTPQGQEAALSTKSPRQVTAQSLGSVDEDRAASPPEGRTAAGGTSRGASADDVPQPSLALQGTSAGLAAARAQRQDSGGSWSPSFPHYEEVDVSLEPEDEVALQGPGMSAASISSKVVLTLGLQQTPVRNGVSIVVTSVRPGSTLERTGLVREGALLLAIDGRSAEGLRGRALRQALQSGLRRRATFFSPMQASLRASPKARALQPQPAVPSIGQGSASVGSMSPPQVQVGPPKVATRDGLGRPSKGGLSEAPPRDSQGGNKAHDKASVDQQGSSSVQLDRAQRSSSGITDEEASIALAAAMAAQRMAAGGGANGVVGLPEGGGYSVGAIRGVAGGLGVGVGTGRSRKASRAAAPSSLLAGRIEGVGARGPASSGASTSGSVSDGGSGGVSLPRARSTSEAAQPTRGVRGTQGVGSGRSHKAPGERVPSGAAPTGGDGDELAKQGLSSQRQGLHSSSHMIAGGGPGGFRAGNGAYGARIGKDHASSAEAVQGETSYGVGVSRGVGSQAASGSGGMAGGMAWFRFWSGGTGRSREGGHGRYGSLSSGK